VIFALYHKLGEIAEGHLIVITSKIICLPSGEPQRLRILLIDGTNLDVWFSLSGKYSYHWDRRIIGKGIYRFDNAQHKKWEKEKTYPHHFHHENENNVIDSSLPQKPEEAIVYVLEFVTSIIAKESGENKKRLFDEF